MFGVTLCLNGNIFMTHLFQFFKWRWFFKRKHFRFGLSQFSIYYVNCGKGKCNINVDIENWSIKPENRINILFVIVVFLRLYYV